MNNRSILALFLGNVSILALASVAIAQDATPPVADQTVVLDPIVLTAGSDVSVQPQGYVGEYTQSATKSDTPLAQQQQSVSVITTAQIEDQGANTLGEALSYSAGVVGQPYGADPRFDGPIIRGFAGDSAQYLNGLRSLRRFSAPAYETYGLQQVEVLKGPSSSLYGAGAPGGIINQVQKRAQDTDFAEAGIGADTNGGYNTFFDVNRAGTENLSWRLTGVLRHEQQQIEELDNSRGYLAGALRYTPTDATTVDVIVSYQKDDPASPGRVPYALTQIADGDELRELYTGEEDLDDSDRRIGSVSVELSHEFANGWKLEQGFRYEKFDWDFSSVYSSFLADPNTIGRGYISQSEDNSNLNLDTRLAGEAVTGAVTHKLLFGLDLRKFDSDDTTLFGNAGPLNWRNPVYGTVEEPTSFTYDRNVNLTARQVGLYAQNELEVGNWRGTLALRQDWYEQEGTITTGGIPARVDQSEQKLTGRAGLGYQFASVMPYVTYSTSFEPSDLTAGTDINGNELKPTTGKQWEVGVKYQPTAFDGLITASVYDLRQENVAVSAAPFGGVLQVGEVKSRGFELEATAAIGARWDLRGSYAYNDTEQVGGFRDGASLPDAPRHTMSLWASHQFDNGLRLGGGVRYLGERKGYGFTAADVYDIDAVTLVDLGASYEMNNVTGSLNISNLTDKTYLANCNGFGCNYGEGRVVQAKVAYKW